MKVSQIAEASVPGRMILLVMALCFLCHVELVTAGESQMHSVGGKSTRRNTLSRRMQSIMIKHTAIPRTRSLGRNRSAAPTVAESKGSVLTFLKPTKERIGNWFGVEEDPTNDLMYSMLQKEFNHESVGMTNPLLRSDTDQRRDINFLSKWRNTERQVHSVVATKITSDDAEKESSWWPGFSFAPRQPQKWRVLRFRRKVGTGLECYQRVRDAALDWEFQVGEDMGLLPVPSASELVRTPKNPANLPRPYVARGRYTMTPIQDDSTQMASSQHLHQCIGAARRFVTFSAKTVAPFLPKIYSVNPVMLVYDIVDQRGPSTTFSSSAYATMKGHLLRGEERVTVAIRDESEAVEVEILSVSRPGLSLKGRVVWPFIGKMQNHFFMKQLDFLDNLGTETDPSARVVRPISNRRGTSPCI